MKIHSKPLNYLSVPTAPAGLAAAHPVQVIVYLSGMDKGVGGGGDCLKDDSRIATACSRENYKGFNYPHQNSEQLHTFL
jgi:hypothetical protein